MLATPVKPRIKLTGGKPAPIFTLHQTENNVLGVQLKGRPEIKTCVVSFTKYNDALKFGRMIERHKKVHYEWPNFNFDDNQDDNILRMVVGNEDNIILKELTIFEWSTIDDARMFCALHFMDLMKMNNIRQTNVETFRLEGDIYRLDLDTASAQQRLNHIYYIESMNTD